MPNRKPILLIPFTLAALLAVSAAVAASRHTSDSPSLNVTFRADKTVSVVDGGGNPVGTSSGAPAVIPPGTYNVFISDPTFVPDIEWDLAGPGVKLTSNMSAGEEISEAWVETFAPNSTYTYRDDNRPPAVWTFVTSAAGSGPTTTTSPPLTSTVPISSGNNGKTKSSNPIGSLASRGALIATVTAAGKATLAFKGKGVTSLKAGKYTVKVTDRAAKAGFSLQEYKKSAKTITTAAFKGKKSLTITLAAGQWVFYPTFVAKKSYFIVTN
jgi:hypothetical protein